MAEPLIITLGGAEYRVRPLTIGQQRELGIGASAEIEKSARLGRSEREAAAWDRWIDIILLGISKEHPDITRENILALPATMDDVTSVVSKILTFAGIKLEPQKPGEPIAESVGETSTVA